ncbi:hypothetical protein MAH1_33950 [Sessilibacter sp. MAH1]
MSFGFEIYDANGRLTLSSESVAWVLIDTFDVQRVNGNGSRSYSTMPNDLTLAAELIAFNTGSLLASGGSGICQLTLNQTNKTLTWQWLADYYGLGNRANNAFNYERATINVYGR